MIWKHEAKIVTIFLNPTYLRNMILKYHIWGCSIQNARVVIKSCEIYTDGKIFFHRFQKYIYSIWNITEFPWNLSFLLDKIPDHMSEFVYKIQNGGKIQIFSEIFKSLVKNL